MPPAPTKAPRAKLIQPMNITPYRVPVKGIPTSTDDLWAARIFKLFSERLELKSYRRLMPLYRSLRRLLYWQDQCVLLRGPEQREAQRMLHVWQLRTIRAVIRLGGGR